MTPNRGDNSTIRAKADGISPHRPLSLFDDTRSECDSDLQGPGGEEGERREL